MEQANTPSDLDSFVRRLATLEFLVLMLWGIGQLQYVLAPIAGRSANDFHQYYAELYFGSSGRSTTVALSHCVKGTTLIYQFAH